MLARLLQIKGLAGIVEPNLLFPRLCSLLAKQAAVLFATTDPALLSSLKKETEQSKAVTLSIVQFLCTSFLPQHSDFVERALFHLLDFSVCIIIAFLRFRALVDPWWFFFVSSLAAIHAICRGLWFRLSGS